jgi:hypothetical protein
MLVTVEYFDLFYPRLSIPRKRAEVISHARFSSGDSARPGGAVYLFELAYLSGQLVDAPALFGRLAYQIAH